MRRVNFFFVHVGLDPLTVIRCATKTGAEIHGAMQQFGTVLVGKLADLLIVAGDVLADIASFENRSSFSPVIQAASSSRSAVSHVTPYLSGAHVPRLRFGLVSIPTRSVSEERAHRFQRLLPMPKQMEFTTGM